MTGVLNLTEGFNPYKYMDLPEIGYSLSVFSGGEPNIRIEDSYLDVYISIRLKSPEDLLVLCCAVNALRNINPKVELHLFTPYLPAARQDRVCRFGEALTSKVYADIINSLCFSSVKYVDAHSDVMPSLLNNSQSHILPLLINQLPIFNGVVVIPDFGATKKIEKWANGVYPTIQGYKRRDENGKLVSFGVYSDNLEGKDVWIIDDICDGGGTFIGLANCLREINCGKVNLYVTHGIFSKGVGHLLNHVDTIYTTNSWSDYEKEKETFSNFNVINIYE